MRHRWWNNPGSLCSLWAVRYLWGRACHWWSPPYERSLGHEDRAGHTLECPSRDIRHIRGPRLHPLSSSRHPHGASLRSESHSAHLHGWGNTAPYAGLGVTGHIDMYTHSGIRIWSAMYLIHMYVDIYITTYIQYAPMHVLPLTSTVIPGGHWQKKEPGVLMHLPLMHTPGNTWHSSTSGR